MRFAFKTSPQNTTWADMLAVWRAADDIELFESGWTFDHFYPIFTDDSSGPCLEGWLTLTALAQATQRLRVGVLVTGMPYRHPTVLANMAATLDIISNGRLELGIGAGWNEEEANAYGIDLGTLTERFDRFDEACEIITGLLTRPSTSFAGRHFTLTDAYCEPKPLQQPHPPITIGGDGPTRTLRAVARYAQRWNTPFTSPEILREKQQVLAAHCADIGRDPSEITITAQTFHDPAKGAASTAEDCAALGEAGCDLVVVGLPSTHHDPAEVERLAAALR